MNSLYLVRHGHTVWSETGGVAGRTDIGLSAVGIKAVKRLAQSLSADRRVTHWYCSPLSRTQDSSGLLREALQRTSSHPLPEQVLDGRIVELDFGDWEGLTWTQVHEEHGAVLKAWGEDWANRSPPGGETFAQQVERCSSWLTDSLEDMALVENAAAMVVCHGGSIRALLCLCLGWPLTRAMDFEIDPATLCWLTRHTPEDAWCVRMINSQFA